MRKIFLSTILLIFSLISYSQAQNPFNLEKVTYTTYTDGTKTAKLHKFEDFFAQDPEQQRLFKKFNRSREILKLINFSSIPMIGATAWVVYNSSQMRNDSSVPVVVIYGVMGLFSTGTIIGLSNAILIPIKNRRKDKLLHYSSSASSVKERPSSKLSIGVQQNGVGMTYSY